MKSALGFFKCSRMLKKKKRGQSLTKFEPVVWTKSTLVWFNSDDFFIDKYEGGGQRGNPVITAYIGQEVEHMMDMSPKTVK